MREWEVLDGTTYLGIVKVDNDDPIEIGRRLAVFGLTEVIERHRLDRTACVEFLTTMALSTS